MARTGPSVGNSRTQRINQARFGDISVRYGKDKRSNVNRSMPSPLKTKFHGGKMDKGFSGNKASPRQRVSRENYNKNRITFSKFVKLSILATIFAFCVWAYVTYDKGAVYQRHRRSISDVLSQINEKYIESTRRSAAAWTRQLRSKGAHSDDMSNPHNGVTNDESIIQKVLSDFAKLVKSESEGYSSNRKEQTYENYVDNSSTNDL